MDYNMKYELLLRIAFGFATNGRTGDRSCDPANLAEAGYFSDHNLPSSKVAAGYAFAILSNAVINHFNTSLADGEHDRLDSLTARAVDSKSVSELAELISEFESSVIDKYYDIQNGVITFKTL